MSDPRALDEAPTAGDLGIRHQSLERMVLEELRERIIGRHLAPGERLVTSLLAEELGVSRGPVRIAIQKLAAEGLVELTPRRGAAVAQVSVREALDCYEVREALEGVAAQRAAMNATPAQIDALQSIISEAREVVSAARWHDLADLNNRFHESLALASNNGELVLMMHHYAVRIAWIFSQSAQQRSSAAWDEHQLIVDAVRQGNTAEAGRCSRAHIAASREKFLQIATERFGNSIDL